MWSILDTATRTAWLAATNEQAQLQTLLTAFGGSPFTARLFAPDGVTLRRVLTLPALTIDTAADPRRIVLGIELADSAISTGTLGRWVLRTAGGVDIMQASAGISGATINHAGGNIRTLCRPTLRGVVITADAVLPAVPLDARISFWGQSNAEGSALRSGISAITADPTLVAWDNGTNTFPRVRFWNGTAYAQYVPGSNHGTTSTLLGPEFGMAVRWMRETTTGVLYMDKAAWGGTSIDLFQPPSAARWNDSISRRNAQNAWLTANGVSIDPSRTFWLWSQAEADSGQSQSWYQPRMQAIVDAIEANGILPFRGVLTDIPTGSPRFNSGISAAKQAVADTTGGLLVRQIEPAFPAFFEADNLHLNARGQVQRSYTAYSFFFDAATITV